MGDLMTTKDRAKFEELWRKLNDKPLSVGDLKKLVYFCILALAGEGYATPELKQAMRRLGLYDLFEEGIN